MLTELHEVFLNRHSTRKFLDSTIPEEDLEEIMESANLAPSAGNLQSLQVFVVTGRSRKRELAAIAHGQDFVSEASACMVFCADRKRSESEYGRRGRELYSIQDATISATYAMLKAVDMGYATSWVGSFDTEQARAFIGSTELLPVAILLIGRNAEEPVPAGRRDTGSIFHRM